MASSGGYVLIEKQVGETPLEAMEKWRQLQNGLEGVPLAYAGRLDPMASGQLLVLIGEECKKQAEYHNLDKEYEVEVLFGIHSDSGDVLGIVSEGQRTEINETILSLELQKMIGEVEFSYPIFSAKTVQGKPLHTWAMEGRLDEIEIPTRKSEIYSLSLNKLSTFTRQAVAEISLAKIERIPPVTDARKALGNDFRRPEVRKAWQDCESAGKADDVFYIASITCVCSSGTYMRTLAEVLAEKMDTTGLAFSIHRSKIGLFDKANGAWIKLF